MRKREEDREEKLEKDHALLECCDSERNNHNFLNFNIIILNPHTHTHQLKHILVWWMDEYEEINESGSLSHHH